MLMLAATLQTKQRRLASRPMLAQVSVIAFVVEMLVIIWFPLPIHHHTRNHIRLLPLYSPHPIITLSSSCHMISSSDSLETPQLPLQAF